MNMKQILTLTILLTSTIWSQAQQVNPVPDYVFRNQMSVGRNAVTDTAAYFSIGPRYGANKGFMPPIVGDTATFSSGKRNGLLIFSVQKNKFLYWDSVRVQWSDMAGSSGSYIVAGDTSAMLAPYLRKVDTTSMLTAYLRKGDTASMLTNYVRHAGYGLTKSGQSFLVDTAAMATRARVQKGIDSIGGLLSGGTIGGSGTTNYVPKFTAGTTIGNSQIFDNGTSVGINTASPASRLHAFGTSGATTIIAEGATNNTAYGRLEMRGRPAAANQSTGYIVAASTEGGQAATNIGTIDFAMSGASGNAHYMAFSTHNGTSLGERLRIFANGRVFVGASPTDAGYQFDINGTLRSVNGANFATTSGGVTIGSTAAPITALDIYGNTSTAFTGFRAQQLIYSTEAFNTTPNASIAFANKFTSGGGYGTLGSISVGKENTTDGNASGYMSFYTYGPSALTEKARINSNGELLINTTTDAGDYKLQVSGNIYNTGSAVLAATSGNVGIGTASPGAKLTVVGAGAQTILNSGSAADARMEFHYNSGREGFISWDTDNLRIQADAGNYLSFYSNATERGRINSAGEWIIDASGTDAGDYKLQVVGNARVGTGKLDIASNTTFGIGVARSGTSEVAGQIYNSNGILYLGAESSAGGQIFSGSSAYAAVIGSGANYPFQIATNNITRATMTTGGNFMLGFTTDSYFYRLQVNGSIFTNNQILVQNSAAQVTVDSSVNTSPLYLSNQSLTGSSAQGLIYGNLKWNTTGAPSAIDLNVTNTASGADANYIKITDGSNIFRVTKDAGIITGIPSGGSAKKWKLGAAATVSPTSPNRTIQIEVDGTVYYLHAKTTND